MKAAILTDTTKCIDCHECVAACKKQNQLSGDVPRRWDAEDGLSAKNWTSVLEGPIPTTPKPGVAGTPPQKAFVRKQCRHCLEPACASACPVGALHKTDLGAVVYDSAKCMGCRYCMMACPYGIPRYEWQAAVPYVRKCIFCYDRISAGQQPACTEACPTKATIFGDRDQLLAEAHRRISETPATYVNKVWGEQEVGGTSVLYVSNVDLSFLTGGRALGTKALPAATAPAMEAVPFVFTGVLTVMAGLSWIIDRRIKIEKKDDQDSKDGSHE
jgi:formate dehydrogenase iron-sulfur subunit